MELLRNSKDKKARKLTKKRVSGVCLTLCFKLRPTRSARISGGWMMDRRWRMGRVIPSDIADTQLGTLLRSKRKLEELSNVIQEQRRQTGH